MKLDAIWLPPGVRGESDVEEARERRVWGGSGGGGGVCGRDEELTAMDETEERV